MLRFTSTVAAPIVVVLIGVLLLEPPALTPADRVPTLRLLSGRAPAVRPPDVALPAAASFLGRWRLAPGTGGADGPDGARLEVTIARRGASVQVDVDAGPGGRTRSAGAIDDGFLLTTATRRRADGTRERVVTRYRRTGPAMIMEQSVSHTDGTRTTRRTLVPLATGDAAPDTGKPAS